MLVPSGVEEGVGVGVIVGVGAGIFVPVGVGDVGELLSTPIKYDANRFVAVCE